MRIEFAENEWLDLELINRSTDAGFCFCAKVSVKAGDFQGLGISEFDRIDASAFSAEVETIQSTLRGEAQVGDNGLSSCSIHLQSKGTTGQFVLKVAIASNDIQPYSSMQHEFVFYTSRLNDVCVPLASFFRVHESCR